MAISEADIKLLWGRSAGMCSRPGCGADLTRLLDAGSGYVVGEMAHVIAKSPGGPRGRDGGGADTYGNLVLLCPTCHRDVDKAPDGTFPQEMLHDWKAQHEQRIRELGSEAQFADLGTLKKAVSALLAENFEIWKTLGPNSDVAKKSPLSNAFRLWELRRVDKIIPNNRKIVNIIRSNKNLLDKEHLIAFSEFANHAESYEEHIYNRRDDYPLFPDSFGRLFS